MFQPRGERVRKVPSWVAVGGGRICDSDTLMKQVAGDGEELSRSFVMPENSARFCVDFFGSFSTAKGEHSHSLCSPENSAKFCVDFLGEFCLQSLSFSLLCSSLVVFRFAVGQRHYLSRDLGLLS